MSAAFIALGMPALATYNPSRSGYGARSTGPDPDLPYELDAAGKAAQHISCGLLIAAVISLCFIVGSRFL